MAEQGSDSDSADKTEEPSQYKIEEARKKGDVSYSKELVSVVVLGSTILTILISSVYVIETFQLYLEWLFRQEINVIFTGDNFNDFVKKSIVTILKMSLPAFITSFVVSIAIYLVQIGFIFAPEVLNLNFERINPTKGIKRIFSTKALFESFKGVIKILLVLAVSFFVIKGHMSGFLGFLNSDLGGALSFGKMILLKNSYYILIGLLLLAMVDYAFEKYNYMKKMRMTKREQKEETKEREGNPEVKQKIKSMQKELARKRMMSEIQSADAIVANPTHFSVAIKYDKDRMVAPKVVAKGIDFLALKIRDIAKDSQVPIIENVKLARNLYYNVEVGEEVPRSFYKAVAEILAYVYKLKKKKQALEMV